MNEPLSTCANASRLPQYMGSNKWRMAQKRSKWMSASADRSSRRVGSVDGLDMVDAISIAKEDAVDSLVEFDLGVGSRSLSQRNAYQRRPAEAPKFASGAVHS